MHLPTCSHLPANFPIVPLDSALPALLCALLYDGIHCVYAIVRCLLFRQYLSCMRAFVSHREVGEQGGWYDSGRPE